MHAIDPFITDVSHRSVVFLHVAIPRHHFLSIHRRNATAHEKIVKMLPEVLFRS